MENNNSSTEATVIELKAATEYQNGSVVSKTIVDRGIGTITIFAFDEGQGLSEHTAPFDAVVHVLDGNASVTVNKIKYEVQEGQMIIMPANVPHSLKAEKRFKMLLTMIRG